ncbi:hypothetical protein D9M70_632300 [compost metagenome]
MAAIAFDHAGQNQADGAQRCRQVDLDHLFDFAPGHVLIGCDRGQDAGIGHQNVGARRLDDRLQALAVVDVEAVWGAAAFVCQRLQIRCAAGDGMDVERQIAQGLGDGAADAFGRSGDDG